MSPRRPEDDLHQQLASALITRLYVDAQRAENRALTAEQLMAQAFGQGLSNFAHRFSIALNQEIQNDPALQIRLRSKLSHVHARYMLVPNPVFDDGPDVPTNVRRLVAPRFESHPKLNLDGRAPHNLNPVRQPITASDWVDFLRTTAQNRSELSLSLTPTLQNVMKNALKMKGPGAKPQDKEEEQLRKRFGISPLSTKPR